MPFLPVECRSKFVLRNLCVSLLSACILAVEPQDEELKTKTFIIVVDSVRWKDLDLPGLDGFKTLAKHGVKARYVNPVYPSNTISNLYSIVTGMYTENHGLVLDDFHTGSGAEVDSLSWWRGVEPIWSAAEREGLRTAVYYFPEACDLPSETPSFCPPQEQYQVTDHQVKHTIREILDNEEIQLAVLYYGRIKSFGLKNGPDSPARLEALKAFDQILQEVQRNLSHVKHEKKVNLVVVSDHGVTACDKLIPVDLRTFKDMIQRQLGQGAFSLLQPVPEKATQLRERLKAWQTSVGVRLYSRNQIPSKYRLKRHPHIPPLLLEAKKGYYILPLSSEDAEDKNKSSLPAGCYGYDPDQVTDMRTIFLARGPVFLRNYTSEPLRNIDHYNLFCHLLDIAPGPNNGSWDRVVKLLKEDEEEEEDYTEDDQDYDYDEEEEDEDEEESDSESSESSSESKGDSKQTEDEDTTDIGNVTTPATTSATQQDTTQRKDLNASLAPSCSSILIFSAVVVWLIGSYRESR